MPLSSNEPQAKILQGRALRTLVVVLILGAAVFGLKWYMSHKNDTSQMFAGNVDGAGMVEAIQYGDDGDHVVVFNEKGQKIDQTNVVKDKRDQDPIWRPDGQRLFFVSDRDGKSYQVYRWAPAPGQEAEVRSQGSLAKSHPDFPLGTKDPDAPMLMVSGGFVVQYDPSNVKGHQLLPPQSGVTTSQESEEGNGSTSQFQGAYGQLGDRFRVAKWDQGTDSVVAVMGSDRGEVLIHQDLTKGDAPKPPDLIATGGHIDFDINPANGSVIYTIQNFTWRSDSKVPVTERFRHCIGSWAPGQKGLQLLLPSRDDTACFGEPTISPKGDQVLVVAGTYNRTTEALDAKTLIIMPTEGNAAAAVAPLVRGDVHEPAWSPDGKSIAYAKAGANGSRSIYISGADGSGEHTLTGDTGSYGHPLFSPMTK